MSKALIELKSELVNLCNNPDILICDKEQLEYLIGLVDYVLIGHLQLDKWIIESIMEEVVATSVIQIQFSLLKYLKPLSELICQEVKG